MKNYGRAICNEWKLHGIFPYDYYRAADLPSYTVCSSKKYRNWCYALHNTMMVFFKYDDNIHKAVSHFCETRSDHFFNTLNDKDGLPFDTPEQKFDYLVIIRIESEKYIYEWLVEHREVLQEYMDFSKL